MNEPLSANESVELERDPLFQLGYRYPVLLDAIMDVADAQFSGANEMGLTSIVLDSGKMDSDFKIDCNPNLVQALVAIADELELSINLNISNAINGGIGLPMIADLNRANLDYISETIENAHKMGGALILKLGSGAVGLDRTLIIELQEPT